MLEDDSIYMESTSATSSSMETSDDADTESESSSDFHITSTFIYD